MKPQKTIYNCKAKKIDFENNNCFYIFCLDKHAGAIKHKTDDVCSNELPACVLPCTSKQTGLSF